MACTKVSFVHVDGTLASQTATNVVVGAGQSLVAYGHWQPGGAATITGCKWNGTEDFIQQGTSPFWILKNPTAGTHDVVMTWSSDPAGRIGLSVWVVANLDQTTVARTPTTNPTDPASDVGDLVLGGMTGSFADTNQWAAEATATEECNVQTNAGSGASSYWMVCESKAGSASTTSMQFQHVVDDPNDTSRQNYIALIAAGAANTTFYLTDAYASGSNHGALQQDGSAPADAATFTGWTVAGRAVGDFARMSYNTERGTASFSSTAQPSGGPDNALGDCFRIGPLTGSFPAGDWNFSFAVRADSLGGTQDGRMNVRVWKSANADGSSATEITAGATALSTVTNLTTSASQNSTGTVTLGAVSLTNEYLFIQLAWEVTGVA